MPSTHYLNLVDNIIFYLTNMQQKPLIYYEIIE